MTKISIKERSNLKKTSYVFLTLFSTIFPSATHADSLTNEETIERFVIGRKITVPRLRENVPGYLNKSKGLLYGPGKFKVKEDEIQKEIKFPPMGKIGMNSSLLEMKGNIPKLGIMDTRFDPSSDTSDSLSKSTESVTEGQDHKMLSFLAHHHGKDHSNHVASIIQKGAPTALLRVIDLNSEFSIAGDDLLVAGIEAAIKSKVDFLNISLLLITQHPLIREDRVISEKVVKALCKARDAGIGIINSAGNDSNTIGDTLYTQSLQQLIEKMQGSMIIVGATCCEEDGHEKLASFSNKAGIAHEYFVAAPGTNIYASGAAHVIMPKSGTSMAAPAVTATAGVIKAAYPDLSAKDVLKAIRFSTRKVLQTQLPHLVDEEFGCGILDVKEALNTAERIDKLRKIGGAIQ